MLCTSIFPWWALIIHRTINNPRPNPVILMAALMIGLLAVPAKADSNVKPKKISAVGKQTVSVNAGQEFELKVRMILKNAEDDYLRLKIVSGSKYVRFDEDDERVGDEVEFKAIKVGKTTVTCTNTKTNQKIIFTINVVR